MDILEKESCELTNSNLKMRLILLLVFTVNFCFSQEIVEIDFSELDLSFNKDSTEVNTVTKSETLNGFYKVATGDNSFIIVNYINGKAEGVLKGYDSGVLTLVREMKNGLPNGISTTYDNSGKKIMYRLNMVNGEKHGHCWWLDIGDTYFIYDKRVSKEEFLEYESKNEH